MDKETLFEHIHNMLSDGEKKKDIIKWICDAKQVSKSQAYRDFDAYMKCPKKYENRNDLREMVKTGIFAIYFNNVNKGYGRAACEALDRIMVLCPWIKEESDVKEDAAINVIIQEWRPPSNDKE